MILTSNQWLGQYTAVALALSLAVLVVDGTVSLATVEVANVDGTYVSEVLFSVADEVNTGETSVPDSLAVLVTVTVDSSVT